MKDIEFWLAHFRATVHAIYSDTHHLHLLGACMHAIAAAIVNTETGEVVYVTPVYKHWTYVEECLNKHLYSKLLADNVVYNAMFNTLHDWLIEQEFEMYQNNGYCNFYIRKVKYEEESPFHKTSVSVYLTSHGDNPTLKHTDLTPNCVFINAAHNKFQRDWECETQLSLPKHEQELQFIQFLITSFLTNPASADHLAYGSGSVLNRYPFTD